MMVDWLIGSSYSNTLDALRRSADIRVLQSHLIGITAYVIWQPGAIT